MSKKKIIPNDELTREWVLTGKKGYWKDLTAIEKIQLMLSKTHMTFALDQIATPYQIATPSGPKIVDNVKAYYKKYKGKIFITEIISY